MTDGRNLKPVTLLLSLFHFHFQLFHGQFGERVFASVRVADDGSLGAAVAIDRGDFNVAAALHKFEVDGHKKLLVVSCRLQVKPFKDLQLTTYNFSTHCHIHHRRHPPPPAPAPIG